jgi:hypothetical protein
MNFLFLHPAVAHCQGHPRTGPTNTPGLLAIHLCLSIPAGGEAITSRADAFPEIPVDARAASPDTATNLSHENMALDLHSPDALPRMALTFGLVAAGLALVSGFGIGQALGIFVLATFASPILSLVIVGPFLLILRRLANLRLVASWLLMLTSAAGAAGIAFLLFAPPA